MVNIKVRVRVRVRVLCSIYLGSSGQLNVGVTQIFVMMNILLKASTQKKNKPIDSISLYDPCM